jgi:tetrahydromethanopterin S-methyltransferase subunit F
MSIDMDVSQIILGAIFAILMIIVLPIVTSNERKRGK